MNIPNDRKNKLLFENSINPEIDLMLDPMEQLDPLEVVNRARVDPVWWMTEACGWSLWDKQRVIAQAILEHERVAVPAAFGVGKTYLSARLALWFLFNHYPSKVITTAPTTRQVRDLLWSELRTAHRTSRRQLGGSVMVQKINIEDDWFALGFSTKDEDVDKFTGYHSPHLLLIFDQACGIPRAVWEAGEGLMVSDHVRWLVISNTTEEQSEMANICLPDRRSDFGRWHIIPINAHESPNVLAGRNIIPGIISHDWIKKREESWGKEDPLYRIYVMAEFVESSAMVVLPQYMRDQMMKLILAPNFDDIEIGVDVADEGMDSTVWVARAGGRLLTIDRVTGNNPMQVVQKTIEFIQKIEALTGHDVQMVKVDKIGPGSGVVSRLSELDFPVLGVNVAEGAIDNTQFLNLKAEMSWEIRNMAEDKRISLTPLYETHRMYMELLEQELTVRYRLTETGKIKMEDKRDFKKRIKRSPDIWDAMVLAYYGTVMPSIGLLYEEENPVDEEALKTSQWRKLIGLDIDIDNDFDEEASSIESLHSQIISNQTSFRFS